MSVAVVDTGLGSAAGGPGAGPAVPGRVPGGSGEWWAVPGVDRPVAPVDPDGLDGLDGLDGPDGLPGVLGPGGVLRGVWEGLTGLGEQVDVAGLPGPLLVDLLAGLVRVERVVQAQLTRVVAAAQAGDVFAGVTGLQARSWLVNVAGLPARDAHRRVRLAAQLGGLPGLAAAWTAGRVGAGQVDLVAGVLGELDEADRAAAADILVPLAQRVPVRALARAVAAVREHTRTGQAAQQAWADRHAGRYLRTAVTVDGMVAVDGMLDPVAGQALRLALHAAAAGTGGAEDARTGPQRAADALGQLAGHYLATGDLPDVAGERPRLVVTIPHTVLTGALADQTLVDTPELGLLPAGTLRRLACDAQVLPAVLGGPSEVLDLGRASRTWTAGQRRAVTLRDGSGCAHPACENRAVDLHHLHWWSRGGPTDLANGAWLCAFHHWLVHDGGWTLTRNPATGAYTFHPPDPDPPEQPADADDPHPPGAGDPDPPEQVPEPEQPPGFDPRPGS